MALVDACRGPLRDWEMFTNLRLKLYRPPAYIKQISSVTALWFCSRTFTGNGSNDHSHSVDITEHWPRLEMEQPRIITPPSTSLPWSCTPKIRHPCTPPPPPPPRSCNISCSVETIKCPYCPSHCIDPSLKLTCLYSSIH